MMLVGLINFYPSILWDLERNISKQWLFLENEVTATNIGWLLAAAGGGVFVVTDEYPSEKASGTRAIVSSYSDTRNFFFLMLDKNCLKNKNIDNLKETKWKL